MQKETIVGSIQGGLVYLKYTFRFRNQFDEPNDDWLDAMRQQVVNFLKRIRGQKTKL
jgi:hypothetical protein